MLVSEIEKLERRLETCDQAELAEISKILLAELKISRNYIAELEAMMNMSSYTREYRSCEVPRS